MEGTGEPRCSGPWGKTRLPTETLWVRDRHWGSGELASLVICATFSGWLVSMSFRFLDRKMQAFILDYSMPEIPSRREAGAGLEEGRCKAVF